jgi:transposase InsO family protein
VIYGAWFEPEFCVFQELKIGKILGIGIGHVSFRVLEIMYPSYFATCCKDKLVCDVCELAKHTRATYPSSNERSRDPFEVVHSDVWGPSTVTSLLGERWFVTFIDGFSRCTWLYVLKQKSDVLSAFKDFYALVGNQYNAKIEVLRSDNGTEYVNKDFDYFLSSNGIIHQTTCVDTAAQNGVAERKNRHLLEVARSHMFEMNVPKFLWGEAIKTAAYLINRMPTRILNFRTPIECLSGTNSFIVPPKVFGCTCFVHDYRNSIGKLDPRAIKCIFVGYSPTQKGYRCWSPTEKCFFLSMDVTFREKEPYYISSNKITPEIDNEGRRLMKDHFVLVKS